MRFASFLFLFSLRFYDAGANTLRRAKAQVEETAATAATIPYKDLGVVVPLGTCGIYKSGLSTLSLCTEGGEGGEFWGAVNNTGQGYICEIQVKVRRK